MLRASFAVLALTSCGSPPPGSVDSESLLVDLATCVRGDVICARSGPVSIGKSIDGGPAVRLSKGASITLPIDNRGKRLAWIAIGLHAEDLTRRLAVTLDGREGAIVEPVWGFARVEIAQNGLVPGPGAQLHIIDEEGTFDLLWVVGRWKD